MNYNLLVLLISIFVEVLVVLVFVAYLVSLRKNTKETRKMRELLLGLVEDSKKDGSNIIIKICSEGSKVDEKVSE